MTESTTIAFDNETTGFQAGDELTVVGFDSAVSSRVFLHPEQHHKQTSRVGVQSSRGALENPRGRRGRWCLSRATDAFLTVR